MTPTTSPSNILITDRTTIETDWLCGMKYWWYKQEGGKGIVPKVEADYFAVGRAIHEDLSALAGGVDYRDYLSTIPDPPIEPSSQIEWEYHQRRLGWIVAFGKWVLPRWLTQYEVVAVEKEMIFDRSPLWIAFTPDLVLRCIDKSLDFYGKLVYKEYKTTSSTSPGWIAHWAKAVQVHIALAALEEETGEKVHCGHVVGLPKGQNRKGKLMHPYVYAYVKGDTWKPDYTYGWDSVGTWNYEPGIEAWVEKCGEELGSAQFVSSAPLFLDRRLLDQMVQRRITRETEIELWKKDAQKNLHVRINKFEQRFNQCIGYNGIECPYLACCFNKSVGDDPIGSGLYVERTPHHDVEIVGAEE